jgi:hypothetical protein
VRTVDRCTHWVLGPKERAEVAAWVRLDSKVKKAPEVRDMSALAERIAGIQDWPLYQDPCIKPCPEND